MKMIIAGAGFGGLRLARKLNNKPGWDILLLDRFNYHQFQPLFYQVATAGLDASNISFPLRKVFHKSRNVRIRIGELVSIKPERNCIETSLGEFDYDILVLATGADTNFFGNRNLAENTFPMKSTVEALRLRHRLIQNFEDALVTRDPMDKQRLMNLVVVGGGPTGVELSGALAEMKKYVLPRDYPELDFNKLSIYLLEGSNNTLSAMSEISSARSRKYLEKLGVNILTQTMVKDYDGKSVFLQDGTSIPAAIVVWAAGIQGNIPEGIASSGWAKGKRISVDAFNRIPGYPNIFAIGDLAYTQTEKSPHGHPQVAPVAIQQADRLAENLLRGPDEKNWAPFQYKDKGSMATVGRNLAVVDIPKPRLHLGGFPAWIIWMSLHLMLILGVKNRLFVFLNWLYNYLTYDQSLRLIFREFDTPRKKL